MRRLFLLGCLLAMTACSETPGDGSDGGTGGMDSGTSRMDGGGNRPDGSTTPTDGGSDVPDGYVDPFGEGGLTILDGGGVLLPDGGVIACSPAPCQGRYYQCGNCLDDDRDGLSDSEDPDCLGPCDNNEAGFNLLIPGIGATCNRDCYFDQDSGSGNDQCGYSLLCDPLSPGTRPRGSSCPFDPRRDCTGERGQPPACLEFCGPLVPNGCDCFGCCEIPGGSGNFVFVGSEPERGQPPCSLATADNPGSCRPCTPNRECFNECGRCELCLGRTELPPECFPPPPPSDGGVPGLPDGGRLDGGRPVPVDGGTPPPPRCPTGQQACGLPGDPACPAGYFCLTGCCIFFG